MAKCTILLTCAGGGLGPQLIRLLQSSQRHAVRVVAVDMIATAPAMHFADHFETVPAGDAPGYIPAMLDLCKRQSVNIIFPGSDEEAFALSGAKDKFAANGVTVACNDMKVVSVVNDKLATYRHLQNIGVSMPIWIEASGADQIVEGIRDVARNHGTAVVKNPLGRGGRGTFVINPDLSEVMTQPGSRELHMNLDTFLSSHLEDAAKSGPQLVMERLQGPTSDLDVLAWKGRPLTMVPRRRHNPTAPNDGHVLFYSEKHEEVGRRIVESLGMSWLFDIDFMLDRDGEPIVLEVNSRASGSMSVSLAAGIPLMDNLISLASGEEIEDAEIPFGQQVYAYNAVTALAQR